MTNDPRDINSIRDERNAQPVGPVGRSNVRVVRTGDRLERPTVRYDLHEVRDTYQTLGAHEQELPIPEGYNIVKDRVRFGPIIAGLATALGSLALLGLFGVAVGLTVVNAGDAARAGQPPAGIGPASATWAILASIVSFMLGGYVAGRTAAVFDRHWGMLNGGLVFMLGIPIALWLAGQGLGFLAGTLGTFADAWSDPYAARTVAGQIPATSPRDIDIAIAA